MPVKRIPAAIAPAPPKPKSSNPVEKDKKTPATPKPTQKAVAGPAAVPVVLPVAVQATASKAGLILTAQSDTSDKENHAHNVSIGPALPVLKVAPQHARLPPGRYIGSSPSKYKLRAAAKRGDPVVDAQTLPATRLPLRTVSAPGAANPTREPTKDANTTTTQTPLPTPVANTLPKLRIRTAANKAKMYDQHWYSDPPTPEDHEQYPVLPAFAQVHGLVPSQGNLPATGRHSWSSVTS